MKFLDLFNKANCSWSQKKLLPKMFNFNNCILPSIYPFLKSRWLYLSILFLDFLWKIYILYFFKLITVAQTALSGRDFCTACHDSYYLLRRNENYSQKFSRIGQFLIFFGKAFVCITTTILSYLIIAESTTYKTSLYSPLMPLIWILVISYMISSFFLNMYGTTIDTIM